jgi:hypothetical protein
MKKSWTEIEVKVLIREIQASPNNNYAAYQSAAKLTGRSVAACKQKARSLHFKSTRRWTDEEDAILIKNIKKCNLRKEAFQKTSKEVGRPVSSCATRWYTVVSLRGDKESVCFGTVFTNKSLINRTRETNKVAATPRKSSWWQKILKLLGF